MIGFDIGSDISPYVTSLPASALPLLEKQLDWDNKVDRNLREIAHLMLDWDGKACTYLGLKEVDIRDIKDIHDAKPELQRYKLCCALWGGEPIYELSSDI